MARSEEPDISAATDEIQTNGNKSVEEFAGFSFEQLASLQTFEDALRLAMESGTLVDSRDLGEGFTPVPEKSALVGTPFIIIDWKYGTQKKFGDRDFLVVKVMTADNRKLLFTDGGTGIMRQIEMYTLLNDGKQQTYVCWGGLTESTYLIGEGDDEFRGKAVPAEYEGKTSEATTYYIAEGVGPSPELAQRYLQKAK